LLKRLERGMDAMLFASGLAAATALLSSWLPNRRVLVPRYMYWALRKWLIYAGAQIGLQVHCYENGRLDDLEAQLKGGPPSLVWIETPANPTWDVQDIAASCELAHRHGGIVAVDSTIATPVLTQPLVLGADYVVHSATKYLNGHSDVVAGAVVAREASDLWARVRNQRVLGGAVLGPFESWLLLRGMRTLHLRVSRSCESALWIARAVAGNADVQAVLYPGLESHPGHEVAAQQMRGGFGGVLSVRLKGGAVRAKRFADSLRIITQATSLGSVESLAEHRASVEGPGTLCPDDLVRLSIGVEHPGDLLADIHQALAASVG